MWHEVVIGRLSAEFRLVQSLFGTAILRRVPIAQIGRQVQVRQDPSLNGHHTPPPSTSHSVFALILIERKMRENLVDSSNSWTFALQLYQT
jgi:hypothetical protein